MSEKYLEVLEDIIGSVEYYEKDKPEYSLVLKAVQKIIEKLSTLPEVLYALSEELSCEQKETIGVKLKLGNISAQLEDLLNAKY